MTRYTGEKIIGQLVILADVVEGSTNGTFEEPPESYFTTRFRHAMLAPADGPARDDLVDRLVHESTYGDIDADGVVTQSIQFLDDERKGVL